LQRKTALLQSLSKPSGAQADRAPTAPPVYRPHPVPHVLQRKSALPQPPVAATQNRAPAAHRPQPVPKVLQPKMNGGLSRTTSGINRPPHAVPTQPQRQQAIVQPSVSNVVQAVKYYPNLHPGAATPVDRSNIFTLNSFADQYRLRKIDSHAVNVPNLKYNFVRTREGEIRLHSRYRHPSLAEGQQVLYAGEIAFNNGRLEWWSNGSGHYQPDDDNADQASLPMDHFYSYQQITKGEHTRKKGSGRHESDK
jgi:hypothetical protein